MNVTKLTAPITALNKRPALVADSFLQEAAQELATALNAPLLLVPRGEACKTREQKAAVEDFLFERGFGADSCLIALGGGSVGDLVGFAASSYCRGIAFVNIPTTLLAMVDASLGGKTAINTAWGKNMLGAYWPSTLTLIETAFLETLPPSEIASGAMEMVKHAAIADRSYLDALLQGPLTAYPLIERSQAIKRAICLSDPQRLLLNFGHTVGHALECYFDYKIPHGLAVGFGMRVEACFSHKQGWLGERDYEYLLHAIDSISGFTLPHEYDPEELIKIMRRDKKAVRGVIHVSGLKRIGEPMDFGGSYVVPCDEELLVSCLEEGVGRGEERPLLVAPNRAFGGGCMPANILPAPSRHRFCIDE